ncbi:MAG: exonuclease [Alphaproteobacteria bacterium]|nr:MAG: exonuclease [Alphaproteobacteria bacterium]
MDIFFSADVETDGPIPGPYSMLSFAMVYAGSFDGERFVAPRDYQSQFYQELKPISDTFQEEALKINGLDRTRLTQTGTDPSVAMDAAWDWIMTVSGGGKPVLVAYPLSFDWSWLHWYFVRFAKHGSPFGHSYCYDIKTAVAVKSRGMISESGRSRLPLHLRGDTAHTHHALADAIEQAEIFAKVFTWNMEIVPPNRDVPTRKSA